MCTFVDVTVNTGGWSSVLEKRATCNRVCSTTVVGAKDDTIPGAVCFNSAGTTVHARYGAKCSTTNVAEVVNTTVGTLCSATVDGAKFTATPGTQFSTLGFDLAVKDTRDGTKCSNPSPMGLGTSTLWTCGRTQFLVRRSSQVLEQSVRPRNVLGHRLPVTQEFGSHHRNVAQVFQEHPKQNVSRAFSRLAVY